MYSIKELIEFPAIKEMANYTHERSLVLYIVDNEVIIIPECIVDGNNERVDIPSLEDIENFCNKLNTNKIVIVHNHPYISGHADAHPSWLDISVTKWYYKWLKENEIDLLDHIIVSPVGYFSFREEGKFIGKKRASIIQRFEEWIAKLVGQPYIHTQD